MLDAATYREKAAHFRKMARDVGGKTAAQLLEIAEDYEELARQVEAGSKPPPPE